MKYLIQNRKEFAITIAALVIAILDMLRVMGVDVPSFSEEYILALISAIIGVMIWFYNIPTSYPNHRLTKVMRQIKKLIKNGDMRLLDQIERVIHEWENEND